MSPDNGKKSESQGAPLSTTGNGSRKPYCPPRLRALGHVNTITLGTSGVGDARKKPQG